jgi:hypothetical protein
MKDSVLHCCPFVVWTHSGIGSFWNDGRDLSVYVYTSKRNNNIPSIPLYINTFEKYISKWISLIPDVIEAIHNYNASVYEEYRNTPLKENKDFANEIEYVFYLKEEYCKRFGDSIKYIFDKAALILGSVLTNEKNISKMEAYKNAIRYALGFMRHSLQDMKDDGFEYTGIKGDNFCETNLLLELISPSVYSDELSEYHYNLSKVYYLEDEDYSYYDKMWARDQIKLMGDFLRKYIDITMNESDKEIVVLVDLAVYLHALEEKCLLNQSIPNKSSYRAKLLCDEKEN